LHNDSPIIGRLAIPEVARAFEDALFLSIIAQTAFFRLIPVNG